MMNRRVKQIVVERGWERHLSDDDQEYKIDQNIDVIYEVKHFDFDF